MFEVIYDAMVHWYVMMNSLIITIDFRNAKNMNCALMFIMSTRFGRKCIRHLLQLEPCNDMFKVISDIMGH